MAYMFVGRDVIEKNILEDSRKFHPKPRFESYTVHTDMYHRI